MGPLDQYVIDENALKSKLNAFELSFQSHWYRSLPLSCMDFSLKLNGEILEPEKFKIKLNQKEFFYSEMIIQQNEWLFILDKAKIEYPLALEKGKTYDIEFKLDLHIPYILVGPQSTPLLASSIIKKNLICK